MEIFLICPNFRQRLLPQDCVCPCLLILRPTFFSAYSAPQSEISGAVLAVKMEQKISQELFNIPLSDPVFIGDSEIVLMMIARNDPADLPIFYGTRIMQISALTKADN